MQRAEQLWHDLGALPTLTAVAALQPFQLNAVALHNAVQAHAAAAQVAKTSSEQAGQALARLLTQVQQDAQPPIQSAVAAIRAASAPRIALQKQAQWRQAATLAENTWRAAQVVAALAEVDRQPPNMAGAAGTAVTTRRAEVIEALHVCDYAAPPAAFWAALQGTVAPWVAAVTEARGAPFQVDWETTADTEQPGGLGGVSSVVIPAVPPPVSPVEAPTISVPPPLARWPWRPGWWHARRRLLAFHVLTFVVAVAILTVLGFKEFYQDVATFGAAGWTDYVKLLALGFGTELGRGQVVHLAQDWGVLPTA